MMIRRMVISLALLGSTAGCDSAEADQTGEAAPAASAKKAVYACNAPSQNDSNCVEWRGGAFPDEDSAKAECTANRGSFAGSACPTENLVATCIRHKGSMMEQHELWYGPKIAAEAIQAACKGPDTEFAAP